MDIVSPEITRYLEDLTRADDEPVLLEMEELARKEKFPIIGRLCGRYLEIMARAIGAKRIFELGSGFGYSGYWFARATGPEAEIHLTDGDPENERKAMDFLKRAGLDEPIRYHVGDAVTALQETQGDFDIIYCDIDKDGYPAAWSVARAKVRVGGLFMCDNVLWSGRVAQESSDALVNAIKELNETVASDPDWRMFVNPQRDGVMTALRLR